MNAVVTLTVGPEFEVLGKLAHPTLKSYAERIGADFVVIKNRTLPQAHPAYEKLQCAQLLEKYRRIIFLDTDILVPNRCPNLFDTVPEGYFGAFQEGKTLSNGKKALAQAKKEWKIDLLHRHLEYFNAGVMVFDQSHKAVFSPPEVFYNNFWDNTWIVIQAMQHAKLYDIGDKFNFMCSNPEWKDRFSKAWIIHYASSIKDLIAKDVGKL